MMLIAVGCSRAEEVKNVELLKVDENNNVSTQSFGDHYQIASRFLQLRNQARELHQAGQYKESLKAMEEGFEYAKNRSDQTIALKQMAETYEAMSDYELAANFYEGAAKSTMNDVQMIAYRAKSQELRQKNQANYDIEDSLNDVDKRFRRIFILTEQKQYAEAVSEHEELSTINQWYERYSRKKIAELYSLMGENQRAYEIYEKWYDSLGSKWERSQHKDEYNQYRQNAGLPAVE